MANFICYDVSFRKETANKSSFVKIGVAFSHTDGSGRIDIVLDALPIGEWNGKMTLFPQQKTDKSKNSDKV